MSHLIVPEKAKVIIKNYTVTLKCLPLVYSQIIEWSWSKVDDETIAEYLNRSRSVENVFTNPYVRKKWMKKYEEQLTKESLEGLDVTFLHDLLPVVSNGRIHYPGTFQYESRVKDPSTVEHLLKKIKDLRNDIRHEKIAAEDITLIATFENLMSECLRVTGELYGLDNHIIDEAKRQMIREFDKQLEDSILPLRYRNDGIRTIIRIKYRIKMEEIAERFMDYQPISCFPTSNINLHTHFHQLHLSRLKRKSRYQVVKESFELEDLYDEASSNFIILSGASGSGKTVSMRRMFCKKLVEQSEILPVYVECGTEQYKSPEDQLKSYIKTEVREFGESDVNTAIMTMEDIIYFIDGYDERTEAAEKFVHSVFYNCTFSSRSMTCIISGKMEASYHIESDLNRRPVKFDSFCIQPITEQKEQESFIETYCNNISSEETKTMVDAFRKMKPKARRAFSSPILLTLFCFMSSIDFFKNISVQNEADVNEAIFYYYEKKVEEKMKPKGDPVMRRDMMGYEKKVEEKMKPKGDPVMTRDMMRFLSIFCLELFKDKKYFAEEAEFEDVLRKCTEHCSSVENMQDLLELILTAEFSRNYNRTTRHFINPSIQEFLAAKGVILELTFKGESMMASIGTGRDPGRKKMRLEQVTFPESDFALSRYERMKQSDVSHELQIIPQSQNSVSVHEGRGSIMRRILGTDKRKRGMLYCIKEIERERKRKSFNKLFVAILGFDQDDPQLKGDLSRYGHLMNMALSLLKKEKHLEKYIDPLEQFMKDYILKEGNFESWLQCISTVENSLTEEEMAVAAKRIKNGGMWIVTEGKHLKPVTGLLAHVQPDTMDITLFDALRGSERKHLKALLSALREHHRGEVRLNLLHSHNNYDPMDDALLELKGAACRVTDVVACVTTNKGLGALNSVLADDVGWAQISFPLKSVPDVQLLKHRISLFSVQYSPHLPRGNKAALPRDSDGLPPSLYITDVPRDGASNTFKIISHFLPADKTFCELQVKRCLLSRADARQLSVKLYDAEVKVEWGGGRGVVQGRDAEDEVYYELLTDGRELQEGEEYLDKDEE